MHRTFLYTKKCQVKRKLFLQNVPQFFSITGALTLTFRCSSSFIGPAWTVCSVANAGVGLFLKVAPLPTGKVLQLLSQDWVLIKFNKDSTGFSSRLLSTYNLLLAY